MLLLTGILALGVAAFFSIRLANRAAVSGFRLFSENVTGTSDLFLTSPSGELPVNVLPEIRRALDDIPAGLFPVLEATATEPARGVDGFTATSFHVIGVDLAALSNLRYLSSSEAPAGATMPDTPGRSSAAETGGSPAVFPSRLLAAKHGWRQGQEIVLVFDDAIHECHVAGILPTGEFQVSQPENLIVMDLPELQGLTAQLARIHRVEIRFPPGHWSEVWGKEAGKRLAEAAGDRWQVETPEQQKTAASTMTRAFRLNLSILSCLALVVGVYLILQALEAAVVRRRPEIATLRALGVSPRAVRRAWQFEALAMGLAGTIAGLLLGWLMAQLTVRAIAQTVNALYFSNTTHAAAWHWGEAALAASLGMLASAVAGWLPAREASETPPAQMLRRGTRSDGIRALMRPRLGLALCLLAAVAHAAPPLKTADGANLPWAGYAAAFLWVAGAGILASTLFPGIGLAGRWRSQRDPGRYYAASQLRHATGRHRLATAGLVVAVAMFGGMSVLIGSFETTVTLWLDQVMKADLFVACQGTSHASSRNRLHAATWQTLQEDPAVADCEVSQYHQIKLDGRLTVLAGTDLKSRDRSLERIWLVEPPDDFLQSGGGGEIARGIMSESFAYRFRRSVGDRVEIPTPSGPREIELVGIFADYGNEFGTVVVAREQLAAWFDDQRVARMAVTLRNGEDFAAVQSRWMQAHPGIVVTNNRELRTEALRIFHQTFAVTHGLKWIGVMVALAGLAMALASMLLERGSELTTLRALGLGQREIGRATAWESAGIAAIGLFAGGLLSLVLGHLIIYVINRQAFGWTLLYTVPWDELLSLGAGVIGIGALVGYLTGSRLTQRSERDR